MIPWSEVSEVEYSTTKAPVTPSPIFPALAQSYLNFQSAVRGQANL